ncbi:MAG: hypothetical protein ACKVZH_12805 [Blastocatellia bacterium]
MIRQFAATVFISALFLTPAVAQNNQPKESAQKVSDANSKGKEVQKTNSPQKTLKPSNSANSPAPLPRPTPPPKGGNGGIGDQGGMKEHSGMNQGGQNQGGMKPGDKGNGGVPTDQFGAEVMIVNVMKEDSAAKPNPNGAGRLVPVRVEWKVKLSPGAKLMELEAVLKTTNTDNSMTTVSKMLSLSANSETIMLPMPEGVFAKEFVLKINSKCSTQSSRTVSSSKMKSGSFPVSAARR